TAASRGGLGRVSEAGQVERRVRERPQRGEQIGAAPAPAMEADDLRLRLPRPLDEDAPVGNGLQHSPRVRGPGFGGGARVASRLTSGQVKVRVMPSTAWICETTILPRSSRLSASVRTITS